MSLYIFVPWLEYCMYWQLHNFLKGGSRTGKSSQKGLKNKGMELLLYKAKLSRLELYNLQEVTEGAEALTLSNEQKLHGEDENLYFSCVELDVGIALSQQFVSQQQGEILCTTNCVLLKLFMWVWRLIAKYLEESIVGHQTKCRKSQELKIVEGWESAQRKYDKCLSCS